MRLSFSERWSKQQTKARERKMRKRFGVAPDEGFWWTEPPRPEVEVPFEPFVPTPNPSSWYQFCVERKTAYEDRGEPIAAMMWWALRMFDYEEDVDPCTEDGYERLCGYWNYKMDWYEAQSPP